MAKKSHRGMHKRLKVTKRGQVLAARGGFHHKQVKKKANRKRQSRRDLQIEGALRKMFLRFMSS